MDICSSNASLLWKLPEFLFQDGPVLLVLITFLIQPLLLDRVYKLKFCVCRHHNNIFNLGPLNHPKILTTFTTWYSLTNPLLDYPNYHDHPGYLTILTTPTTLTTWLPWPPWPPWSPQTHNIFYILVSTYLNHYDHLTSPTTLTQNHVISLFRGWV